MVNIYAIIYTDLQLKLFHKLLCGLRNIKIQMELKIWVTTKKNFKDMIRRLTTSDERFNIIADIDLIFACSNILTRK